MIRRMVTVGVVGIVAVAATIAILALVTRTPDLPSAEPVVEEYLTALANGDASTARSLDVAYWEADNSPVGAWDSESLASDAVLGGAIERISDVRLTELTDGHTASRIEAEFSLDGVEYDTSLPLNWDDASERWILQDSLVGCFGVVWTIGVSEGYLGFTLAGVAVPGDEQYAMYPGVYPISFDVDPALLADPASLPDRVVVPPTGGCQTLEVPLTARP